MSAIESIPEDAEMPAESINVSEDRSTATDAKADQKASDPPVLPPLTLSASEQRLHSFHESRLRHSSSVAVLPSVEALRNKENSWRDRLAHLKSAARSRPRRETYDSKTLPVIPLPIGKMEIVNRADDLPVPGRPSRTRITRVLKVERTAHVYLDPLTGQYKGLPKDWEAELKKQFGLPINTYERVDDGYPSKIPAVLVRLRDALFDQGGLDQMGIFRIAGDATHVDFVKREFNSGTFQHCADLNVLATLIKRWFRELPAPLFKVDQCERAMACRTEEQAQAVIDAFPEPEKSVLLWLLDVCVAVSRNSEVNRMTAQNLAIVMAPNLMPPPAPPVPGKPVCPEDAMQIMERSKSFSRFLEICIRNRAATLQQLEMLALTVTQLQPSELKLELQAPHVTSALQPAEVNLHA